jgi:hypothetical protein
VRIAALFGAVIACALTLDATTGPALSWHVEHDAASVAETSRIDPATLTLRYRLGGGRPTNQFAALVAAIGGGLTNYASVSFSGRADHPMRVAVQLRPGGHDNPPRWQRSVYLDESPRTVTVSFSDMQPVPRTTATPVPLGSIDALMFVVDTNNTAPGTTGVVTIGGVVWSALH